MFDDYPNIVDNVNVQPRELSIASLTSAAMSSPSSELKRPLSSLTFAANVFLSGGLDAGSMKITNIVIHALNGFVLYFLVLELFRVVYDLPQCQWHRDLIALAATLAWLALPINVTAVLYIVQRMESLANLFVLLGLLGYLRARRRMQASDRPGIFGAIAWCTCPAILGLAAKETAVLLPLYGACLEVFIFRLRSGRQALLDRRLLAFYGVILGFPMLMALLYLGPGLFRPTTWATRSFSLETRLLSETRVIVDYIGWTLVPLPSSLSFYHDDFTPSSGWLSPISTIVSSAFIVSLISTLWIIRHRLPVVALGGAWFFACHTLTGTVLPLELIYEHRNYFASIGVVILLADLSRHAYLFASTMSHHWRFIKALPIGFATVFIGWSACITSYTAHAWSTPLGVAEDLGVRGPYSPRAQYELGRAYVIASHYQPDSPFVPKATASLERAGELPGSPVLAEQALIFMNAHMGIPEKPSWWTSMQVKLAQHPVTVQDDSALISLSTCVQQGQCKLDTTELDHAFKVAVEKPTSSARLKGSYSEFAKHIMHNQSLSLRMMKAASVQAHSEPVYHILLARLQIEAGNREAAINEREILLRLNTGGRLTADIADLDRRIAASGRTSEPTN